MAKSFKNWLFEKRDVDSMIIAFIISSACSDFIGSFTKGVVNPIIESLLPITDDDLIQTLNIYDILVIDFKLHLLLSGFVKLLINFLLAYVIVMYIFTVLKI